MANADMFPDEFNTEVHGASIKVTDNSDGLISIYNMQELANRLLSGRRITQAEQQAAGASILHLAAITKADYNRQIDKVIESEIADHRRTVTDGKVINY